MQLPDENLIPAAANLALFLDFDGTLVPFADKPENVLVPDNLPSDLATIGSHLNGALAIITGRPIDQVDDFLNAAVPAVAGEHGAVTRFPDGGLVRVDLPDMSAELKAARAGVADMAGVWIEEKSAGFAIHYRQAPQRKSDVQTALAPLIAGRPELHLLDGNHVFELRAARANKGAAVDQFMALAPFKGRMPVFIGDDTTDEDGFAAAQNAGGLGIKVGEGETCARVRWSACTDVHGFLFKLARA